VSFVKRSYAVVMYIRNCHYRIAGDVREALDHIGQPLHQSEGVLRL
jgi:hypothetical protein